MFHLVNDKFDQTVHKLMDWLWNEFGGKKWHDVELAKGRLQWEQMPDKFGE